MDLNEQAVLAAHLAFDTAMGAEKDAPTILRRMGILNEALAAYEQERRAQQKMKALDEKSLRASFEQWADGDGLNLMRTGGGAYFSHSTRSAWRGYKAHAMKAVNEP